MKTYIGIDPGERWTGIGIIAFNSKATTWLFGVLDHESDYLRSAHLLNDALPEIVHPRVVIEDYRVRPVGHQRFTRGITLRALGALEYVCDLHDLAPIIIPPGNVDSELRQMHIHSILDQWSTHWNSLKNWEHGRSAFRLLGQAILREEPIHMNLFYDPHHLTTQSNSVSKRLEKIWRSGFGRRDLWAPPLTMMRV